MTSHRRHRTRALLSCAADGLAAGGGTALRELPAWSRGRWAGYSALAGLVAVDALTGEAGLDPAGADGAPPLPAHERVAMARYAAVMAGWAALSKVAEERAAAALRRRGHRRPWLLLGALVGPAVAASTLPVWWQRASARIEQEQAARDLEAELAELLAGEAP